MKRCAHLVLVFLASMLVACGSSGEGQAVSEREPATPPSATATRVEVATIAPTRATLELHLPGEVEGSRDAMLAAALGGYVERVMVEEGDVVRRGQVLARVDTASHGAHAAQLRVELDAATVELDRAERLAGAITAQQRAAAETRVAAARAALRSAQVQASRATIKAPFAGTVAQVDVEEGEVAAPGAPIVRLVQLDPIQVSLAVPDRDVVALREGMPVRVHAGATATPVEGAIIHVSPAADLRTRAFEVVVELPNPDGRLLPGMIAQVSVRDDPEQGAEQVVVPQYVLVTRLDGNGVFVEADGEARWRPLRVGAVVRNQVVIDEGLAAGDRLIVTGHRELAEGDEVLVMREGRCCEGGRVSFDGAAGPSGGATGDEAEGPATDSASDPAPAEDSAPAEEQG